MNVSQSNEMFFILVFAKLHFFSGKEGIKAYPELNAIRVRFFFCALKVEKALLAVTTFQTLYQSFVCEEVICINR